MAALWWVLAVCVVVREATGSQEVLTNLSKEFGKALEDCKKEENVGEHIMQDFFNFWREDYALVNRELGCMILCMARKLGLMDDNNRMHHGNAQEFAKKHGADEALTKQLLTILHDCETQFDGVEDHCARILEHAKCFRTKIHALNWAPSMSVVLQEVME